VGPWLALDTLAPDPEEPDGEPVPGLAAGATPEVDPPVEVVSLAVPVDVGLASAVDVVSVDVAVDVVTLVDVVTFVEAVVEAEIEVDADGALVEVALTSTDASFGAETESDAAGASAVMDVVASTDATSGAETDNEEVLALVSTDGDAETDTLEIPSARASTGAATTRISAANAQIYALFLFISPTTATPRTTR
jgi:hypothetical protein